MASEHEYNIPIDDVLRLATTAHQRGVTDKAQEFYEAVLQAQPDNIDALHYYGILLHQIGQSEEGLASIDKALSLGANSAEVHNNKGNVLKELKRYDAAEQQYRRALSIDHEQVDALCNLGVVLRITERDEEAIEYLRRATALNPEHGETWHNLGNALREQRDSEGAIECYEKAVEFGAYRYSSGRSARNLAIILASTGRTEQAEKVLRNWLRQDPENAVAQHLFAALTKDSVPDRAADEFVVQSFRDYAESFDESLANLKYQAPQLVGARVAKILAEPSGTMAVCDLGCGTGLVAQYIAPYAARLTGVDLSLPMLSKAKERGLYQELIEEEITAYLASQPQTFDLVTCVDTLCYLGKLDAVISNCAQALRPSGCFVFTVEAIADNGGSSDYEIGPSGRYRQARPYLERTLSSAGFTSILNESVTLRNEGGEPVSGFLCSCRIP
ncbi:MAG: tetratricopeptide repeat protein [Pseudomonadota bacterium]